MTSPSQRGGYQPPRHPAPVSGPGRLSARTDGGPGSQRQPIRDLPNPDYGEQSTFRGMQAAAPMAAAPATPAAPPRADLSQVVPLNAPSQRPGEPVTAGAAAGPGPGMDALGAGGPADPGVQNLRTILPTLELMANMPTASAAFRQYVRRVRGAL